MSAKNRHLLNVEATIMAAIKPGDTVVLDPDYDYEGFPTLAQLALKQSRGEITPWNMEREYIPVGFIETGVIFCPKAALKLVKSKRPTLLLEPVEPEDVVPSDTDQGLLFFVAMGTLSRVDTIRHDAEDGKWYVWSDNWSGGGDSCVPDDGTLFRLKFPKPIS